MQNKQGNKPRTHARATIFPFGLVCAFAVFLFWVPADRLSPPAAQAQQSSPSPSNPFELVAQQFSKNAPPTDVNGFLLNPQWGWQVNHPIKFENGVPKPTLENFPDSIDPKLCKKYDFSDCDGPGDQTDFDSVGFCPMCNLGRRRENRKLGHVNWFPATYTGDICFHNASFPDMDYTFSLRPRMGAGLTLWNHPSKPDRKGKPVNPEVLPQAIHVEFDSRETVNFFKSNIWKEFREHASPCRWWDFRNSCNIEAAMNMISLRRAVVLGLIGLDSEHDIYSESHPVYAIAIEVNPDPHNNTWIVFARNAGNEGNCSSEDHPLIWPAGSGTLLETLKLLIPPPVGVKVNEVSARATQFFSNNGTCPELGYYQNERYSEDSEGVLVSFNLKPCSQGGECQPLVEGEIHLDWKFERGVVDADVLARPPDKCLSYEERDEEENEKYKDPSPSQAVQLLRLLAEERSRGAREMNGCASGVNVPIPRVLASDQLGDIQAVDFLFRKAMVGTDGKRVKKNYRKISDILFPD